MSGYTNDVTGQYDSDEDQLRLEVTRPALDAGLVVEDADGNPTRLAKVYVYGFDDLLLVVDAEHVSPSDRAALVASAAQETSVVHRGAAASVSTADTGYQVQLPGCKLAGFHRGDTAHISAAQGVLVIHDGGQARLAGELTGRRQAQTGGDP